MAGIGEFAAGLGDGAAEGTCGVHPSLNDGLCIGHGLLMAGVIGHAAGQFGNPGDEGATGLAPADDGFRAHVTRCRIGISGEIRGPAAPDVAWLVRLWVEC